MDSEVAHLRVRWAFMCKEELHANAVTWWEDSSFSDNEENKWKTSVPDSSRRGYLNQSSAENTKMLHIPLKLGGKEGFCEGTNKLRR